MAAVVVCFILNNQDASSSGNLKVENGVQEEAEFESFTRAQTLVSRICLNYKSKS